MSIREERFCEQYGRGEPIYHTFCPYRVCPLGAHIDHQHGVAMGFAIDKGIHITYRPTENGVVELHSMNFHGMAQFHVNAVPDRQNEWSDYLRGATRSLARAYVLRRGIHAVIEGTLPIGGLSSSAAVIIAFLKALCHANGIALTEHELIDTALWAENAYVGVNLGKLDQSCEVFSRKGQLLFLDTKDDTYQLIPQNPSMKPYEIAIFFSGVERTLAGSIYNTRVNELKAAAHALLGYAGMPYGHIEDSYLRDVPREVFDAYKGRLPENWRRRATHFYTEYARVEQGAKAFAAGDIETFGQLIFESGHSSIYNYETGSPELIRIYEIMKELPGVYGGRFSGAGFKGCCMALIDPAYREEIEERMTRAYLQSFPELTGKFSVHFCQTADGCTM